MSPTRKILITAFLLIAIVSMWVAAYFATQGKSPYSAAASMQALGFVLAAAYAAISHRR